MSDADSSDTKEKWYSRPVFFVSTVDTALGFYAGSLNFKMAWDYVDNGRRIVAQVNRGSACEIILCEDAARAGRSRVFISLEEYELAELQRTIESNSIPARQESWGYDVITLRDPDGNELMFPLED